MSNLLGDVQIKVSYDLSSGETVLQINKLLVFLY